VFLNDFGRYFFIILLATGGTPIQNHYSIYCLYKGWPKK